MSKSHALRSALLGVIVATSTSVADAQTTYVGADNNVTSLAQMVNAQAAAANFLAVAGSLSVVDFESAIPAGLTITGGTTTTLDVNCGAVCGFNTTAGGQFFRRVNGGSVTFAFTNPVDAFGFFVNGLQTNLVPQQTIRYVDGSSVTRTINMPTSIDGGGAFIGFIDFGQLISSVTFNATNDFLGFDDLRFGRSAVDPGNPMPPVPEPSTYLLMATGLAGLLLLRRNLKNV